MTEPVVLPGKITYVPDPACYGKPLPIGRLRESEREHVAIILFKKMEHLDPTAAGIIEDEDFGWSKLDDRTKEYYRLCVDAVARALR